MFTVVSGFAMLMTESLSTVWRIENHEYHSDNRR